MSYTYVIADMHGRYDLLQKAITEIMKDHYVPQEQTVIILGDMIDRGPHSAQILSFLKAASEVENSTKFIILRGNHEDIMIESIEKMLSLSWWIGNGGGETLRSYGYVHGENLYPLKPLLVEHLQWLQILPYIHEDKHRVYVHADLNESLPLDQQKPDFITWNMTDKYYNQGYQGRHVVQGHMQYEDGPILMTNRTNLDAFAWYTGRLVVGVFADNRAGGPVRIIEVKE